MKHGGYLERAEDGRAGPALSLDQTGSNPSRPTSHSCAVGACPIAPASSGGDGTLISVGKISRAASSSTGSPRRAKGRRHEGTRDRATLNLGDCSPGGVGPGVTCMTQLVMDPTKAGAAPQNRPIGFARVNGQWEVAVW
ncbi:hypothetical protein EGJ58_06515 [Brucella anthropi]|nr:hypothetical protein EGJ58_06515 [Brucella anthropi]